MGELERVHLLKHYIISWSMKIKHRTSTTDHPQPQVDCYALVIPNVTRSIRADWRRLSLMIQLRLVELMARVSFDIPSVFDNENKHRAGSNSPNKSEIWVLFNKFDGGLNCYSSSKHSKVARSSRWCRECSLECMGTNLCCKEVCT